MIADGRTPRLLFLDRQGTRLGEQALPGIAYGVRHDRRAHDGYWVLIDEGGKPALTKRDWSGNERQRVSLHRSELLRAQRLRGLDFVFGHRPEGDLLLLLFDNVRGIPVIEGITIKSGETRFATRFAGGDFAGLRAETYRHGAALELVMLEWWVAKDGRDLELWRYSRGFLSRQDERRLASGIVAFDLPPWREIWGVKDEALIRLPTDGAPITVSLPEIRPTAVSIDG